MKHTTDEYSQLLEGRLPTSTLEFELCDRLIELQEQVKNCSIPNVMQWVAFDFMKIETRPQKYGKYLVTRKDGKIHWETWNGSGWAYNHNEIRYWAVIQPPCA